MKLITASAIFCMASTALIFTPNVQAQTLANWDKKTTVTFSAPVEIPGVHLKGYATLPAGTYTFRLLDSQVNRHVVQIQNEDQSVTYATILAVPNTRLKRTDDTVITFSERPAGEPPALRAWFYPGATWGDEFVYPKKRAKELAQANKTSVLHNSDETSAEVTEPIQTPSAPAIAEMNAAPVTAYNQTGDEEELSQAVTPPTETAETQQTQNDQVQVAQNTEPAAMPAAAPTPAATPEPAPSELPHTGSSLGLMMLGGLLSLGGALGLRSILQRA